MRVTVRHVSAFARSARLYPLPRYRVSRRTTTASRVPVDARVQQALSSNVCSLSPLLSVRHFQLFAIRPSARPIHGSALDSIWVAFNLAYPPSSPSVLVLFATHLLTQPDPAYRPYHCTLIRPPRHRLSASYPSRPSYPRPAYFISDIVEQGRHPPPHILGTQHFITAYSHCDPNLGHAHPVSPFCVLCIASQPQVSRPSISTRRPPAMQQ